MRSDRISKELKKEYICGNCRSINRYDLGNIITLDKLLSISDCKKFLGIPRRLIEQARDDGEIDFIDISNTNKPRTIFRLRDILDWIQFTLHERRRNTKNLVSDLNAKS